MVASASFIEFLREQLEPLGHLAFRRMFGKTGVFCDGLMLGMVKDDLLYFRMDDQNKGAFKEAEIHPLESVRGSHVRLSFCRAPERLYDEPEEFVNWVRAALEATRRVAGKREQVAAKPKLRRKSAWRAKLKTSPSP